MSDSNKILNIKELHSLKINDTIGSYRPEHNRSVKSNENRYWHFHPFRISFFNIGSSYQRTNTYRDIKSYRI